MKEELTAKTDIKEICHQENQTKFTQTIGTPVIEDQLIRDLKFLGNSIVYSNILQGSYALPQELDEITKEFIKELKRPSEILNTPKANISTKMF